MTKHAYRQLTETDLLTSKRSHPRFLITKHMRKFPDDEPADTVPDTPVPPPPPKPGP